MSFRWFFILLIAIFLGYWFLSFSDVSEADIQVITISPSVEKYLAPHKELIGDDYEGYRGHIYRVLSYTMHFLKGNEKHREVIEAALVYYDIGLWTDSVLDYLDPSWEQAKKNLKDMSQEQLSLIHDIIIYHHKMTTFQGGQHAEIVEAVRKADWIDATMGLISQGMSRANIAKVKGSIPEAGFHQTLIEFGPKLYGWNVCEQQNSP